MNSNQVAKRHGTCSSGGRQVAEDLSYSCTTGVGRTAMPQKYLLYIDVLGFSDLVRRRGAVTKLYKIINSLNVHRHHAFRTIAFSDTLLVYNIDDPTTPHARHYIVMYMCEFAQDLFYRLIGKDLHFRAYLTIGDFNVRNLENMQAFYGKALITSYEREKTIQCTGLFIDGALLPDCDIFHYKQYDGTSYFVHLMQSLDQTRYRDVTYPLPRILIDSGGAEWFLAYDFTYLRNIHGHMNSTSLDPRVRIKHASAWNMIRKRHKLLLDTLENNGFDPRSICEIDWSEAMRRVGTKDGFHG
jgi:hypothetical protein